MKLKTINHIQLLKHLLATSMKYIYDILKANKCKLSIIYFYMVGYQLLFLIEPFLLGKTIDDLLAGKYFWIWFLLGTELLANVFMYKRLVYDTKVYTRIYNDIVFEYLENDKSSNASSRIARTEMSNWLVAFFEDYVPYYIMSIMTIIGSLFFIFIEHIPTGFVVLACIPFICMIVYKFYRKISQSTRLANSHYEQKIDILTEGDTSKEKTFFERRRRIVIFGSTLQGKNWATLNSTKTIFLVLALIVFTHKNVGLTQGQSISMYAYINQFLISLMSIPIGVDIWARIQDIVSRLKTKEC